MAIKSINEEKCVGCGSCVETCPMDIFRQERKGDTPSFPYAEDCMACSLCVNYCPKDAIEVVSGQIPNILHAWDVHSLR